MGMWIRAGHDDWSMSVEQFNEMRDDLARMLGLDPDTNEAAEGQWPIVDCRYADDTDVQAGRATNSDQVVVSTPDNPQIPTTQAALLFVFNLSDPGTEFQTLSSIECTALVPALDEVITRWRCDLTKRRWIHSLTDLRACCAFAAENHVALEIT
ncbi:hypothetical protein AWB85_21715 [Mycobacteroides immunogenum]|uniref:Uncharacterized protein n=1 Tax=Mycobacteroides immunogenum TaxID=83262 RepID=A0A179VEE4_9MYCO|nr:hypothetical protein [Mycobacteroides immunogenum]OAT69383.1 hypothetical protein AWB85_21715 [Mycobacteroides immunogenum]